MWGFALVAVALSLLAAAPARAAEQLLDTITVPANSSTVIQGSYQLKAGTRYVIEVSGTMESVATDTGYGYRFDALYCVSGIGFDHEECEDERRDPSNRTLRAQDLKLSSGALENDWRLADQFLSTSKPVGDQPAVDYDPNHSYTLGFYAPADGPIKAQTYYAATGGCPGCANSTTGTFTVKVFGEPPAPAPSPSPSPPPEPSPSPAPNPPAACASAAAVLAQAAQCADPSCVGNCKKLNTKWILPLPGSGRTVDIGGVTIDPEARQILVDIGITDATQQQIIAALIVNARQARLREEMRGCVLFALDVIPNPPVKHELQDSYNAMRPAALAAACAKIVADEADRARRTLGAAVALSAQAGCDIRFLPFSTRAQRRSAKRRRRLVAQVKRTLAGSCVRAPDGSVTFALRSKVRRTPLHRLTGRRIAARMARVNRRGATTRPSSRLLVRWRRP